MEFFIGSNRARFLAGALLAGVLGSSASHANPPVGDWGPPINAHALPGSSSEINTFSIDGCVSLSRDGLDLYFTSFRDGTADIYVASRSSVGKGFGKPTKLPRTVNTNSANEACPTIIGRNELHFLRSEGSDQGNLFVSRRNSGGWEEATPFNPSFNTPGLEESVAIFEDDDGNEVIVFSRRNPDGTGGVILQSVAGASPTPVPGGPNAQGSNNRPWVSRDGLMIAFDSTRPGGKGATDIWFAERASTAEPFGPAYTIPELNSPSVDLRPTISWDHTEIFFSSARSGSLAPPGAAFAAPDIWVAQRPRLRGPKSVQFPPSD